MPITTNRHRNYGTHHHHSPPKHHPKLLSIFLKFIVMSLILSLFLIFIGLATITLLLIASFLHGRRRHRRRTTTPSPPPPTSAYSLLDLQTHLPPFQYSSSYSSSIDCSICLENFKESEFCRSLPECDHVFHAHCVDSWLTKVPNCPVCRRRVRLEVDRPSTDRIDGDDDECKFLWVIGVGRQI